MSKNPGKKRGAKKHFKGHGKLQAFLKSGWELEGLDVTLGVGHGG